MGQLLLNDKDGLPHSFIIAGDTPSATEQSRISSILAGNPQAPAAPPPAPGGIGSLLAETGSNFVRGAKNIVPSVEAAGNFLGGSIAGETGTFLGSTQDQYDTAMRADQAREDQGPEGGVFDQGGIGGTIKYMGYQMGQSMPASLGAIAGGAASGAATDALLGTAAGPAGTLGGLLVGGVMGAVGAGLASMPQNIDQNVQEQDKAHPGTLNRGKVLTGAVTQSALEGVGTEATMMAGGVMSGPLGRVFAKTGVDALAGSVGKAAAAATGSVIPDSIVSAATKGALATVAKKAGQGALMGMTAESVTEAAQQAVQRWQADEPLGNAEAQQEYIQNAIVGGLMGGFMGAGEGVVGGSIHLSDAAKKAQIKADLLAADDPETAAENLRKFNQGIHDRAEGEINAEDALRQGSQDINDVPQITGDLYHPLDSGHPDDPLITGPNTVMREPSASSTSAEPSPAKGAPEAGPGPSTPTGPASPAPPKIFKEQEYADAVAKMAQEKLISADKIKNAMKIGRAKAQAIFDAMRERTDGRPAGTDNQYLSPVTKSVSGDTEREAAAGAPKEDAGAKENAPTITRKFEVRPITDENASPYKIILQGGRRLDTSFKTAEEAHQFADDSGLSKSTDYAVEHVPESGQHAVHEITSGVEGRGATSRFVKAFDTNEEAHAFARAMDPSLSPEANEALAEEKATTTPGTDPNRLARIEKRKQQIREELKGHLQGLVDHVVGAGRAVVDLEDQIKRWGYDAHGNHVPLHEGHIIEGETRAFKNGMIRMALAHGIHDTSLPRAEFMKKIGGIAHHETIHVLRAAGVIKGTEWKSLVTRANQHVAGKKYSYLERAQVRTGMTHGPHLEEEAVAEMYRDHMKDPLAFSGDTRSTLRKMKDFVKTFGQYMNHIQEGNKLLSDIGAGKLAGRERVPLSEAIGAWHSSIKVPGFFLKSSRYMDDLAEKQPDLTLRGDEWMKRINNQKFSPEELKWLGLNDWLKGQKEVQARDVAQFIRDNSVDIQEDVRGTEPDMALSRDAAQKREIALKLYEADGDASYREYFDNWADEQISMNGPHKEAVRAYRQANERTARAREEVKPFHKRVTQTGGSDYREFIFHMPTLQPVFRVGGHFDGYPNVLAHARVKTRIIDGKKMLFVEEMQSDLHQQARTKGYYSADNDRQYQEVQDKMAVLFAQIRAYEKRGDVDQLPEADFNHLSDLNNEHHELTKERYRLLNASQIPEAPLRTKWSDFVVKRLVRHAIETGHDGISWHGEAQSVAESEHWGEIFQEGDRWKTQHEPATDVTGIVGSYLDRLTKTMRDVFKSFGSPQPKLVPKEDVHTTGDLKIDYLFSNHSDMDILLQQISDHAPDLRKLVHKAQQIRMQQASHGRFDAMEILNKAQMPLGRMYEVVDEIYPDWQNTMYDEGFREGHVPADDEYGNPNFDRWTMDFTPEMQSIMDDGQSMFSAVKRDTPAPDTPEFRKWFAGSKIVGDDGKPLVLYHGTTKNFDEFRRSQYTGADMGAGFYFSDNTKDVANNYAGHGPDMDYKLEEATDELHNNGEDVDLDERGHDKNVRASFFDHEGATIPAYLNMKNPLYVGGDKDSVFEHHDLVRFMQIVKGVGKGFLNVDVKKLGRDITPDEKDSIKASDLIHDAKRSGGLMDAIDPFSGMLAGPEVLRLSFQAMGFDGIIDTQVGKKFASMEGMTPDTKHYIAFEPNQVKSVNNTGSYDPEDNRFMFSSAYNPSYSAVGTFGGRVPQQVPSGSRADIESRMLYNVIAPTFEKFLNVVGKLPGAKRLGLNAHSASEMSEGSVISLQDRMQPMAKLIDNVRKNGGTIAEHNDAYQTEQLMHGQMGFDLKQADKLYYKPLIDSIAKMGGTQADVEELLRKYPSTVVSINGTPMETEVVQSILNQHKGSPKKALAELYLYAQHAQERNAVMRDRNKDLINERPDQYQHGSGMSDARAQEILDWVRTKPFAKDMSDLSNPNSVRSRMRALIKHTNDTRVNGGLNPDFRTMIDPVTKLPYDTYQDYVPMRGWTDDNTDRINDNTDETMALIGKRFKIKGKEDKNALGRQSVGSNVIANAALQNEEAVIRANKNKVAQATLALARDNTNLHMAGLPGQVPHHMADFIEEVPLMARKPTYDKKSGVVRMSSQNISNDPDVFVAKLGGTEVGMRIKEPRLRAALMGDSLLGQTGQNGLIKALLKMNRFLAAVRTSLNPEFIMGNFMRDFGHAMVNMTEYEVNGFKKKVIADALPAIRGVWQGLREGHGAWKDVFDDFESHGGKTEFMGQRDLSTRIERLAKDLSEDPKGNLQKIGEKLKAVSDVIEHSNDAIENGIRVATYKNLVEHFQSTSPDPVRTIEGDKRRAAMMAKNLTTNFNMGGTMKPSLNAWYLFFNAGMQGSASMLNPMIRNKYVRRVWLGAVAGGAMQDILMSMLSPVDADGEKEYDKIPDQILQTNMVFLNPLGGYFKIPMPYLFNAAWNSGRSGIRAARGAYTPGQALNNTFGTMAEAFNPFGGGGSWLNYLAPTVLDPFVDLSTNTNFQGSPIAPPKDPYSSNDIPAQRYWSNTSPAFITAAKWIDKLTGGDGVFKGAVSYSPNQYDYVFDYIGGGALSTVMRALDFIGPQPIGQGNLYKMLDGQGHDVSLNDIPFARRVLGNLSSRDDLSSYIANRDKVLTVLDKMRDARKSGDTEEYQRIITDYPDAYKQAARVNAMENARRKIGGEIKKVTANTRLADDKKAQLVDALKRKQTDLVNKANAFMNGK